MDKFKGPKQPMQLSDSMNLITAAMETIEANSIAIRSAIGGLVAITPVNIEEGISSLVLRQMSIVAQADYLAGRAEILAGTLKITRSVLESQLGRSYEELDLDILAEETE